MDLLLTGGGFAGERDVKPYSSMRSQIKWLRIPYVTGLVLAGLPITELLSRPIIFL
ncbi:MAG: hypothetical protein ACYT04_92960 [Nostoc sp.]